MATKLEKIESQIRNNQKNVKFSDLLKLCEYYFGEARIHASHHMFSKPWQGDPRINIQDDKGDAKPYQVKQIIKAIDKLKGIKND